MTDTTPGSGGPINILMIEAAGACNAACSYCPRGAGLLGPDSQKLITFQVLEKALDLATRGKNHAVYLHHRGEPFLHPSLPEIVRRVRSRGLYAFLATNLISAKPERVRDVLAAGLNQLEMHLSAGLTMLDHHVLLQRIHEIRKINWEMRNFGCRLEVNYGLRNGETPESVAALHAGSPYYDELLYVRWFRPHDWPSLARIQNRGVDYRNCEWYRQSSCAVLSNGDVVICCLDQFGHSTLVNVMDIDRIEAEHLSRRAMCAGCVQHVEMGWLREDAIEMPPWLKRKLQVDTWIA